MSKLIQLVALEQVAFFAYHGFYEAEQVMGTTFLVDVRVSFCLHEASCTEELASTVNYEQLYAIVALAMNTTQKLLESVVKTIFDAIQQQFSFLDKIEVVIRKQNLPMQGRIGNALVQLTWTR